MPMVLDQNFKWEFYIVQENKWIWRKSNISNTISITSKNIYATKIDCILNAIQNGYQVDSLSSMV